jgi:hypothetical protein
MGQIGIADPVSASSIQTPSGGKQRSCRAGAGFTSRSFVASHADSSPPASALVMERLTIADGTNSLEAPQVGGPAGADFFPPGLYVGEY